ncbi:MAG: DUF4976 domain-containing protein [Planctomycetes bacterium]|nr:DUF4976 domain-containing protein [Planctomycetota bacterium]
MDYTAIRTKRYNYIRYIDLEGMDELCNLKSEPYGMKNVIADPAAQATLGQLKDELETLLKDTP